MSTVSMTSDIRPDEEQVPSPEQVKVDEIADSLTAWAALIRANPGLFALFHNRYPFSDWNGYVTSGAAQDRQRAVLAELARVGLRAGVKVDKQTSGANLFGVALTVGVIKMTVYGDRNEVCERVVVGTREVTEEAPDPAAVAALPTTTVTRVEEIVEWRCGSLLADARPPAGRTGGAE